MLFPLLLEFDEIFQYKILTRQFFQEGIEGQEEVEEEVQKMLSRYFHFLPFQSQAPVSSGKESLVFLIRGLILGNILTATVDIVGRIFGLNILGKILGNIDLNC